MSDMPENIFVIDDFHRSGPSEYRYKLNGAKKHPQQAITKYIRADLTGLQCLYDYEGELPDKFIALYSDGSGCEMYFRKDRWYYPAELTPEELDGSGGVDKDWFVDAGYLWFIALPDDFRVWGEDA